MNSIIYAELGDLAHDPEDQVKVVLVPFNRLGFGANTLMSKQELVIYDMDDRLEGTGIVQKVDFTNKQVELLVMRSSIKKVQVKKTSHFIITGTSARRFLPYASFSIILALLYLFDYVLRGNQFTTEITSDGSIVSTKSLMLDSYANIAVYNFIPQDAFPYLGSLPALLLFLVPLIVFAYTAHHWNQNGDRTTGAIATVLTGVIVSIAIQVFLTTLGFLGWVNSGIIEALTSGITGWVVFGLGVVSTGMLLLRKQW